VINRKDLEKRAVDLGADYFGVADLAPVRQAMREQSGTRLDAFPTAISIGIALPNVIVDKIKDQNDLAARMNYGHHSYTVINQRLDFVASLLASHIQKSGYSVYPVPASQTVDAERSLSVFSHKIAAHLSGLGWIGKSCMLITSRNGPRVRWASILTDVPLEATGEKTQEKCGNCTACIKICPAEAYSGRPFVETEHRDMRLNPQKCLDYTSELRNSTGNGNCGLCLYVCPHGRTNRK
jgi:epoxyqueuosine reductase QueG